MEIEKFENSPTGTLVPINGTDPRFGEWTHFAFLPNDLPDAPLVLSSDTQLQVTNARVALASLKRAAPQLPNPQLLRGPTLRREAQSTSALEGTYAPLEAVFASDEDFEPSDKNLREVMNYVASANFAFKAVADGIPLSVNHLENLQARLVLGTQADNPHGGKIRDIQVMIGTHTGARVEDARFIPPPPGLDLPIQIRTLLDWIQNDARKNIDPVVAAAMAHYQFETLHPFNDGNGRIGRLLVVLHLMSWKVIDEPMLSISEWFEARRADYYDLLLEVSTNGNWDRWINFFARGLEYSALEADGRLTDLLAARENMKLRIDQSQLRSITAMQLVDFALGNIIFGSKEVEKNLLLSNGRANILINQLADLGILKQLGQTKRPRLFFAPEVYSIYARGK